MSTATLRVSGSLISQPAAVSRARRTVPKAALPQPCQMARLPRSTFFGHSQRLSLQFPRSRGTTRLQAPAVAHDTAALTALVAQLAPVLSLAGAMWFLSRGTMGGMGGMGPGQAKFSENTETGVTFDDVAGIDEAKAELQEIVEFLKNPKNFAGMGAKIPRGCLLRGEPGTGKTLLAKAVAGEAGVPFISISASQFIELYVGVGASRVRKLFETARKKAPCIVFIDEIDAVGKTRSMGPGGGNDERDQTINQLLTEMDGFLPNSGVVVIAATNRADLLDSALTRPGRFDRQVVVGRPDAKGREKILQVHARGKPLADNVNLKDLAQQTPGFVGADLANLINEAALCAIRNKHAKITQADLLAALERITTGVERNVEVSAETKALVATHEAGHALVGAFLPDYDTVRKITIIPRGNAGGMTMLSPAAQRESSGLYTRQYMEDAIAVALGGRIAEEVVYGKAQSTSGASSDLERVTHIARDMVQKLGFNETIGAFVLEAPQGQMKLDRGIGTDLANAIDREVKVIVRRNYKRAKDILQGHPELLRALSDTLVKKGNVSGEELQAMIDARQGF